MNYEEAIRMILKIRQFRTKHTAIIDKISTNDLSRSFTLSSAISYDVLT